MRDLKEFITEFQDKNRVVRVKYTFLPEDADRVVDYHYLLMAIQSKGGSVAIWDEVVGYAFISTMREDGHQIVVVCSDLVEFMSNKREDLEYFIDKYISK